MGNLRIPRWWLRAGLVILLAGLAAANADPEDELKAATVLTFVRHTVWLQGAPRGPITIGVMGRPSMIHTLQRSLDGKTANNRAIRIVDARAAAELTSCQVLYVATDDNTAVRQTLAVVRTSHPLTIGETGRFLEDGGAVNLLLVDGHMSFEVSVEALDRAGVSISSTLLRYGQVKVRPHA